MNYKNQNLIEMKNNISTIFYSTILSALAILVCAWINMLTYTHSNRFIVGTIVAPVNEEIIKFVASMFLATQTKLNRVASGFLLGFLFGLLETFLYYNLQLVSGIFFLFRFVMAVPLHSITTGIAGFKKEYIVISIVLHSLYNLAYMHSISIFSITLFIIITGILLLWLLFFNSNKKRIDAKYYLEKNKLLILSIVISILIFLLYVLYRGEIYINCIKALHIQGYCL